MRHRVFRSLLIASTATLAVAAGPQTPAPAFIVHEWGTFTSIAGPDGQAVQWMPLTQQTDLPCFVERSLANVKSGLWGTVRMETPVLYFYAARALDATVRVAFPQGLITEWYPHADVSSRLPAVVDSGATIEWAHVEVQPSATEAFTVEPAPSHYYAARHTTSNPIRVNAQSEKFLFYRGVGRFQPPLLAMTRSDGGVALRSVNGVALGDVILFENRRGAMTFTAHHLGSADAVLPRAPLDDASGPPLVELKRLLVASGLYEQEAQAMVDTWRDSWFEEGARLLYIVARADVDAVLPLAISPKPSAVTRVFVGRIELVTPATVGEVRAAIASGDRAVLAKYGRFLLPIAERAGMAGSIRANLLPSVPPAPCR